MVEITLKIVRVFIGSPGGLEIQRQVAKRVVDEINQSHAEHWGCQIKLVAWEATLPGYSRAQSLINQDLDKCDYFVGVLWNHWGSKPDDGDGKYTSGFEEEFERARERVENGLMKDIALFFKQIDEAQIKDPGESVQQVLDFREKCTKERRPLFKQFKEDEEFDPLFRAKIEAIGWNEFNALKARAKEVLDPEQPATDEKKGPDTSDASHGLVGASSVSFVTELLSRSAEWEATDSYEVARFRLIAFSAFRMGNDEMYLGNHDANLLFSKRNDYNFDENEIRALIDTGIVGFHHQNVPLWSWIAASSQIGNTFERVKILAAFGNEQEKPNAIRLLQCADQRTPELDELLDKKRILSNWLVGEIADKNFEAALEFLRTNGDSEDLEIVEKFVAEAPAKRKSALAATVVLMWAKTDLSTAFERLIELDPDTMGEAGTNILFENAETVPTAVATRCLKLKSENIRRSAALMLHARQAIDVSTAEALLADPDLEVRLVAVETLMQQGTALGEDTIRGVLVRQRPGGLLGGYGRTGQPDDSYYKKYRLNRLSQLTYDDLRRKVDACNVFENLEITALYRNHTRKCLVEIRSNITDRFKVYFNKKLALTAALYQHDAQEVAKVQKLEDYLRGILTSKALDVLCRYASDVDLELVRGTVENSEVNVSEEILRFFERFGDWTDVPRVLALGQRRYSGAMSLLVATDLWVNPIARTLYAIGKDRLADLLQLDIDNSVRRALIVQFSQKDIAKLNDSFLIKQLNSGDDQSRKVLALKCVRSLTQTRIRRLLDKYIAQQGQRYYNSIHWLDLGASMARSTAKTVAKFELAKQA